MACGGEQHSCRFVLDTVSYSLLVTTCCFLVQQGGLVRGRKKELFQGPDYGLRGDSTWQLRGLSARGGGSRSLNRGRSPPPDPGRGVDGFSFFVSKKSNCSRTQVGAGGRMSGPAGGSALWLLMLIMTLISFRSHFLQRGKNEARSKVHYRRRSRGGGVQGADPRLGPGGSEGEAPILEQGWVNVQRSKVRSLDSNTLRGTRRMDCQSTQTQCQNTKGLPCGPSGCILGPLLVLSWILTNSGAPQAFWRLLT